VTRGDPKAERTAGFDAACQAANQPTGAADFDRDDRRNAGLEGRRAHSFVRKGDFLTVSVSAESSMAPGLTSWAMA
jgi:hypothetical protein